MEEPDSETAAVRAIAFPLLVLGEISAERASSLPHRILKGELFSLSSQATEQAIQQNPLQSLSVKCMASFCELNDTVFLAWD